MQKGLKGIEKQEAGQERYKTTDKSNTNCTWDYCENTLSRYIKD
jgi:hypothetical protein